MIYSSHQFQLHLLTGICIIIVKIIKNTEYTLEQTINACASNKTIHVNMKDSILIEIGFNLFMVTRSIPNNGTIVSKPDTASQLSV